MHYSTIIPFLLGTALARKITVKNQCQSTIWAGMHTGGTEPPKHPTGWEMTAGAVEAFDVPEKWTAGRIWARTGCAITPDGMFQCLTGNCGKGPVGAGLNGSILCELTNEPPSTLAEFTLVPGVEDWYDVSLVDGFNIPMEIIPSTDCARPKCETNINPMCPPLLRTGIDTEGRNLGCIHPCNAGFGQELYGNRACCSGGYNDPDLCAICGIDYYSLFKDNCRTSYAYAYDEKSETALYRCPAPAGSEANYEVILCPNNTDYVGAVTPVGTYEAATATCSSKVTTGIQTFSVPPSPTIIKTNILPIKATAATGLDGAAAFQTSSSSSSSSTISLIASKTSSTSKDTGVPTPVVDGEKAGNYAIVDTETFVVTSPQPQPSETVNRTTTSASSASAGGGEGKAPVVVTVTITSLVTVEGEESSSSTTSSTSSKDAAADEAKATAKPVKAGYEAVGGGKGGQFLSLA